MKREEIDALLETVRNLVHEQYADGLFRFCEALTCELLGRNVIGAESFRHWLTYQLLDIDLASPGAQLLQRMRGLCDAAKEGKLPLPPSEHTSRAVERTLAATARRRRAARAKPRKQP